MRTSNVNNIPLQIVSSNLNAEEIDTSYTIKTSGQIVLSAAAAGTFKFQASNDPINFPVPKEAVNWIDIPSATVGTTAAGAYLISAFDVTFQFIRAVWNYTGIGSQTITTIADTGIIQHQTVTTVADVAGSLNSSYFILSSINLVTKVQKNFYMWFNVNSQGVDPALPGKTAVPIAVATGASANTIATSMRTALNALTNDFIATGSSAAVIITNRAPGPVPAAANGTASTGFTFGSATLGVTSNLNNTYFFINNSVADGGTQFYVWFNVNGIGTDPILVGPTAIPVAINAGDTSSIATATASAIQGAAAMTASAALAVITTTNTSAGPFTPAADFDTGFTFGGTEGIGTIAVQVKTLGF